MASLSHVYEIKSPFNGFQMAPNAQMVLFGVSGPGYWMPTGCFTLHLFLHGSDFSAVCARSSVV